MALVSPRSMRFAGQLAWERGLKIEVRPANQTEASKLIDDLLAGKHGAPIAVADWQLDAIRERIVECVEKVSNFDASAFAELPEDRASANKAIRELDRMLNRATWHTTDTAAFLTTADSAEAPSVAPADVDTGKVEDADVPF